MNPQKLKKLSDLFGHDLAGWKITRCHILEGVDHTLMGSFPAITTKGKEMVVVFEKSFLQKVWNRLERRRAKVTTFMVVVNLATGIVFDLDSDYKELQRPLRVLTDTQIDELCQEENPFQWTPGIYDGSKPLKDPVFV